MILSSVGDDGRSVEALTRAVRAFAAARDWEQFHDPKNLVMALASEAGELAAVLRWTRNDESDTLVASGTARARLESEIGDVAICLLLLCDRTNIDVGAAILRKIESNASKYPVEASRGRAERPDPARTA